MELFDKKFVYLEWDDVLKGKKVVIADTLVELKKELHNELFVSVKENKGDYPFTPSEDDKNFVHMNFAMAYYDPNYKCKVAYAQGKRIQFKSQYGDKEWVDCEGPAWTDTYEYRVKPEAEMWTACIDDKGVVSIIPTCEWTKSKGRQLIEGTKEKCETFAIKNFCNKCAYHAACVGHKCIMNLDMWYCQGFSKLKPVLKSVKKRRMTNRELARWLAEGNGECLQNTIAFAVWNYLAENKDKPVSDYVRIRGWDETEWHEPEVEE